MKFTQFKKHLQDEGAQPIYLFHGEECYFRDKGVAMLKALVSQPELNYTSFDGAALKGDKLKALADAVYAFPFLSEKRMVLVSEFYPSEKDYATYLKPLFERPAESTVLVISNGEAKPKAGACDWKKKPNLTLVDCARADEESIAKWIYLTFKQSGIYADGNVCSTILRYCVCDMARISKEVEKLKDYLGGEGKITLDDVNALVYPDNEYKLYELTQAAARKDYAKFIQIMDGMVGKGFDETAFLNSLCAHFRTLYEVAAFKGNNAQAAQALDMKEFAVKKSREQAAKFSLDALGGYYTDLYGALAAGRAGEITFSAALKDIIAKIFFKTY